jgi:hypothetical protein
MSFFKERTAVSRSRGVVRLTPPVAESPDEPADQLSGVPLASPRLSAAPANGDAAHRRDYPTHCTATTPRTPRAQSAGGA